MVTLQKLKASPSTFDGVRAARMGGYGFCFYGPYQHFWYGLLDKYFPTKSLPHFGTKVSFGPLGTRYTSLACQMQMSWLVAVADVFHEVVCAILSHGRNSLSHT